MRGSPEVSIVIPAYNAASTIEEVIRAAEKALGEAGQIVVVDAGSGDETADIADRLGALVVRSPERCGPAEARNLGVSRLQSEVILFIDSDCVAHPDTVDRVREAFAEDPELVSLTGSYDDRPPDPGFFSQYLNLRHHFTHQIAKREDATFWAGCGAVRRSAFLEVGGFDEKRYPRPQIEDIELSLRLAALGHRRLDPELQVTHLKAWTLSSVVRTDISSRAIPWTKLILERGNLPSDLNLRPAQRLAAAVSPLALLALPLIPSLGAYLVIAPSLSTHAAQAIIWIQLAAFAILALSVLLNAGLIRCFWRSRGLVFAVAGWAFHQVHLSYSAATFAMLLLRLRFSRRRNAAPARPTL